MKNNLVILTVIVMPMRGEKPRTPLWTIGDKDYR